ncbi:HIT family protein [Hoyosella rhizosphaerae]|nr:HIT family protein [Hoyosella rhizosphaerae]MBN4928355.1 HIT family protein [Hoyosella rhizosphaerae]
MATLFSKIIAGEIPGRFIWADDDVVAFLTIAPVAPGHTLVVPRQEVDQWQDVDPALFARCTEVAQKIGQGVRKAWDAPRAGLLIAGIEVPHLHLHVFPAWSIQDFDLSLAKPGVDAEMDAAADKLRAALRDLGFGDTVTSKAP